MGFKDADPVEQMLCLDVEKVTPAALMEYIKTWYAGLFERDLDVNYVKDTAILKKFCKDFGSDAGLIVKCIFVRHNGMRYNREFTMTMLSQYSRDWHKELLGEVNGIVAREEERALAQARLDSDGGKRYKTSGKKYGFMTAKEFFGSEFASV